MGTEDTDNRSRQSDLGDRGVEIRLTSRAERSLIRNGGSYRHIDFHIQVGRVPEVGPGRRQPVSLSLVLDRSGSMAGDKLEMAKSAALAVVDRLAEGDRLAVVVFDNEIDVIQPAAPVTPELKTRVGLALKAIEARATTALHEGWLTGCHAIAGEELGGGGDNLARCFLLTDGLANVGETDPERIAAEAAGIRQNARISTSTFGIGEDYSEELLAPMAVAGGGQFHHLRGPRDIASTFVGELGDLLATATRQMRLELRLPPGVTLEVVSSYWTEQISPDGRTWSIEVGDLPGGEERHVVVRLGFPPQNGLEGHTILARLLCVVSGSTFSTDWHEVRFTYADDQACEVEPRDRTVMHWVGLHHSHLAQREAARLGKQGDLPAGRERLRKVMARIEEYAGDDAELQAALREMRSLHSRLAERPLSSMAAKETWFRSNLLSRGQKDFRQPFPGPANPNRPLDGPHDVATDVVNRCLVPRVRWPQSIPPNVSAEELRDLYRGCLLWGAVGDALGRAVEGMTPTAIRDRYGPEGLQSYAPWCGWRGGPKGTITDDTELTIEVARTLLASRDAFDAEGFSRRLVAWLPHGRGKGRSTVEAVQALASGEPWWTAGLVVNSAGNGAAMRAAPVGLARALNSTPWELCRDAVLSAFPTHTHPVGLAGAVVISAGVAWCVRERLNGAQSLDKQAFLDFVIRAIDGMEPGPTRERRPGGRAIRLSERLGELAGLLERKTPKEVFDYTWNGAFALESVPAALYCFLRSPDDPRQVIVTAVNGGHDADTVASMAGNLAGAWCGARRLEAEEAEWWNDLEYREELIGLADRLLELSLGVKSTGGSKG